MHIDYLINERDYRAASMLAMRKRSNLTSLEYYGPYIVTCVWITACVITGALDDTIDMLLCFGAVPMLIIYLRMRKSHQIKEFKKMRSLHLLQALDIDAQGLRLVTSEGVVRNKWNFFTKFAEDKESFVLFHRETILFSMVPKAHLKLAQQDELRSLLAANLPLA